MKKKYLNGTWLKISFSLFCDFRNASVYVYFWCTLCNVLFK